MTEPVDRAAVKRERRIARQLERLLVRPGAADKLAATFARIDSDPDFAAKVGPLVVRTFRRIDRVSTIRGAVGRLGGEAANQRLTRQQRSERSRPGGRAAFYQTPEQRRQPIKRVRGEPAPLPEGTEAMATTYAHQLQARRKARKIRLRLVD